MKKIISAIVFLFTAIASAELNQKAVSCVKAAGDNDLVVTVVNDESLKAVVSSVGQNQEHVILRRDVTHSFKYNFSSYESADHEFYLLISRMDGKGQMLLKAGDNMISSDNLICHELQ